MEEVGFGLHRKRNLTNDFCSIFASSERITSYINYYFTFYSFIRDLYPCLPPKGFLQSWFFIFLGESVDKPMHMGIWEGDSWLPDPLCMFVCPPTSPFYSVGCSFGELMGIFYSSWLALWWGIFHLPYTGYSGIVELAIRRSARVFPVVEVDSGWIWHGEHH